MYIEFIDLLRCTGTHEESQLVAAFSRVDDRHVIEAKLGCPVCAAEYFIRDEVAIFGDGPRDGPIADDSGAYTIRICAFLNLMPPGKTVLLAGELANPSASVAETSGARVISLNSPSPTHAVDNVAEIRAGSRIPLASRSLDGIALDEAHATPEMLVESARLLRPAGRVYLKSRVALPQQFRELAGVENEIVAELVGDLVSLRSRR